SFRKSFVAGTRGSVPALLGVGVGQLAASWAAPAALATGLRTRRPGLAVVGALGWAAQGLAHAHAARLMGTTGRYAPLAPVRCSAAWCWTERLACCVAGRVGKGGKPATEHLLELGFCAGERGWCGPSSRWFRVTRSADHLLLGSPVGRSGQPGTRLSRGAL